MASDDEWLTENNWEDSDDECEAVESKIEPESWVSVPRIVDNNKPTSSAKDNTKNQSQSSNHGREGKEKPTLKQLATHNANKPLSEPEEAISKVPKEAKVMPSYTEAPKSTGGTSKTILASSQTDHSVERRLIRELGFSPDESIETLPISFVTTVRNRFPLSYLTSSITRTENAPNIALTLPLFVDGALMFPAILSGICGAPPDRIAKHTTPARLKGYTRCAVKSGPWAAAFPSAEPGDEIQGMVIFELESRDGRARMTFFLGEKYRAQRGMAEIVSAEGTTVMHEVLFFAWNWPSDWLSIPEKGPGHDPASFKPSVPWCASRMIRDPQVQGWFQGVGEVVPGPPLK